MCAAHERGPARRVIATDNPPAGVRHTPFTPDRVKKALG
jgi:hypothetical protein